MKNLFVFGAVMLLFASAFAFADSSVTVCSGENAVFEFELYNQAEPLTYSITASGITGVLSLNKVYLERDQKVNFTFTASTKDKAAGTYPFSIVADGQASVSRASATLTVANCYSSVIVANPASISIPRCNSGKVKISVQNTGTKSDSYSITSSGDLTTTFSQSFVTVSPSSSSTIDATISVPCSATAGTHTVQVSSSGKIKQTASITVQVTAPTPTPIPAGCAYANPSCKSPMVCQDNKCVLPPGCKYNNPVCQSGFSCDNSTNSCREIPKVPAPVLTSPVKDDACRGEVVQYDYEITNPSTVSQTYAISVNGVIASVKPSAVIDVAANKTVPFSVFVDTASITPKAYSFNVTAKSKANSVAASGSLNVRECYSGSISVTGSDISMCPSQIIVRSVTVKNKGAESDIFMLSSKGPSDMRVEFQPSALMLAQGEEKSALAIITAPSIYNASGESRVLTVAATSNSIASTQMRIVLSALASCPSTSGPTMFLEAVRACQGEIARFKFGLYNPENNTKVFNLSMQSELNGTLSVPFLSVNAKNSSDIYYTVNTSEVAIGKYPITLSASSGSSNAYVASQLLVEDCFGSNLTWIGGSGENGTIIIVLPTATPTAAPSATPVVTANATTVPTLKANATASPTAKANASAMPTANATAKPIGVLTASIPQGLSMESGLVKKFSVTVRNNAGYDVKSVRILISNMTLSSSAPIAVIPAGKSASVDVIASTTVAVPFNATLRAIGEQGFGDAVFFVNATAGRISAKALKVSTLPVNGTNGTSEYVNTTVRLFNYANSSVNVTLLMREANVKLSQQKVAIPAKSYIELALSTQLPKGKDYNATLVATTSDGRIYSMPISLKAISPSGSTGLVSGGLVSLFSLALVAIGVILVLYYFSRRNGTDEDECEDDDPEESGQEEEPEPKKSKKK
ncbi:MAG: hypothetical protein WC408_02130 [Candidatus Micrarchaeia archaeon]|jgi:uncharacterized membrane protein